MSLRAILLTLATASGMHAADALTCDLTAYKPQPGLKAESGNGSVTLSWNGAAGSELRASFGVNRGQPVISELAARKSGGAWAILGHDLTPEYEVTSGIRRISEQQMAPLRKLGRTDAAYLDEQKWNAFWDAPLNTPGDIRRSIASYDVKSCAVKTEGSRLEVTFTGVSMGIFSGRLTYTAYQGTNLLRQEVVAKTEEASVAYKYRAGLKGFQLEPAQRVIWRDTSRAWQKYEFGGTVNRDPVALKARNRLAIVEGEHGSLAFFPPPHKFFFAREIEMNLGYVWYRKDDDKSFSIGIRHGDREEMYKPFGVSDAEWEKRVKESRHFAANFALYNAPPGTWQRMPMYLYLSPEDGAATQQAVLAFTHDDVFKPLPGYQVAISHFHTHFNEVLADAGTLDLQTPWVTVFRSLGVNIAMMSDFHGDGHNTDPGPLRFEEQKTYFDGSARHSDKDFLIMPGEEPDANFGGHYTMVFPKPVYWSHVRKPGQPFEESDAKYGHVYHAGSEAEELAMLRREGGLIWQAHPRTKGSSGYPDAVRENEYFRSDRFLGGSFQSLPVDQSEQRICEARCFGVLDDMNNWSGEKYLIAEGDTYAKYPEDETYGQLLVNYVKLPRLPRFQEDWSPILESMRRGDFFVTSGEVLLKRLVVEGVGNARTLVADLEWTFPMEFAEVVWGDGEKVERQILSMTGRAPFSGETLRVPFDASGKKWVRFAAWDSAGNGAAGQPIHLK